MLLKETLLSKRITAHYDVSTKLSLLSNQHISALLNSATPLATGIGGTTALLQINDTTLFIKKIHLTDLEKQSKHIMSTANLFNLPPYCHYGIGSPGFGVWRELATHIMTTNWILTGECPNFPLMYHWRWLPRIKTDPTAHDLEELEREVKLWDGSVNVRQRLEARLNASSDIVLFLEYVPENLNTWLRKQLSKGNEVFGSACTMVKENLETITTFIKSRGLLHFDAHFMNIMTDGHRLYLADFGLATSSLFELSKIESAFFKKHHNYDQCFTMTYFVEWILTALFQAENWFTGNYNKVLHDYVNGKGKPLPHTIENIVNCYAPLTVAMNAFFLKLKNDKKTPYPTNELEKLWEKTVHNRQERTR